MPYKAVIFDLDGVLTDTSTYHFKAWKELVLPLGIELEETFEPQLRGISRLDSLRHILNTYQPQHRYKELDIQKLAHKKNDHYLTLIKAMTPHDLYEGVRPLLDFLVAEGLKIGLASASLNAPFLLEALGITHYFNHVSNPLNHKSKPDPGLFLEALNAFNLKPSEALGVEDASAGITAIKAAGIGALGIGEADELKAADFIYPTLKAVPFSLFTS